MDILFKLANFILEIDKHLGNIIEVYGTQTYAILFIIVFIETGLVFMPFLPGDSLIFAAGAFAATGKLNIWLLYILLVLAAFIGDNVNYKIGQILGKKVESLEKNKLIKKEHFDRASEFFDKHGGKAIIYARFMPIIRTFAPFVAGAGRMKYMQFVLYNILSAFLWVTIFLFVGFFFGNIEFVKDRFSIIIIGIIFISLMPMVITFINGKIKARSNKTK